MRGKPLARQRIGYDRRSAISKLIASESGIRCEKTGPETTADRSSQQMASLSSQDQMLNIVAGQFEARESPMSSAYGRSLIVAALAMLVQAIPLSAEPVESFYRGKTLTLIVASDVSGEYTTSARLLARHMSKHIPGNPTIIIQNMPGASGVNAANYLYEVAARDGSVLGLASREVALYQASRMANVRYMVQNFSWLGSMSGANNLLVVWSATGIRSIADARTREVIMGALARNGTLATYPLILNAIAGTKFKLVLGYAGSQVVDLAMERGEVEGKGSYSWANLKRTHGDWVRDGKINMLVQFGLHKETELPDVPLITEFARNDRERAVLDLISSDTVMARPILVPPNAPSERVAAMRMAFDDVMTDPDFLADARSSRVDIKPMSGSDLQALIRKTIDTPRDIIDLAQQWMTLE